MVSLTSLNNMISYMSNFQKTNSASDVFATDFNSRQFQQLVNKIQEQSLPTSVSFRTSAYELKASAQDVLASNKNAQINSKKVSSSSSAVEGTADNGASVDKYSVKVSQLAAAQTNSTASLKSTDVTKLSEGSHTFTVTSQGKTTNVTFSVKEGDTNKESLDKMAKAINGSNSGVTAKVVNDEKNNTSRLEITGKETGEKQTFELKDLTGDAISTLGADKVSQTAKDAKYTIDGEEKTSSKNQVTLDNAKVKLTLKAVTSKEETVEVKNDKSAIKESIMNFVSDYNKAIKNSAGDEQAASVTKFNKELKGISNSSKGQLYGIGITVASDGTMTVDEDKLVKAIDEDSSKVKRAVGGLEQIASKTVKVADKAVKGSYEAGSSTSSLSDYKTYFKNGTSTKYLQNLSRGSFIDTIL